MSAVPPRQESGFLWVEAGEAREGAIAEIAPILPIARTFTFTLPESLEQSVALGQRVMVRMGKQGRLVEGFVVALDRRRWDSTLRPIDSVSEASNLLTPELIALARDISEHYACPLGPTLKAMTPAAARRQAGMATVRYAQLTAPLATIMATAERLGPKQRRAIEFLEGSGIATRVDRLLEETGVSASVLRTLTKNGWLLITEKKELPRSDDADAAIVEPSFQLNEAQQQAVARLHENIARSAFKVSVLFGVSGSGKTEVYIHAIRRAVETGGQAIFLVPEIVLTTQLAQRLASRLPDVAVLHSGLTDSHRSVMWRRIANGDIRVLIGTRSAVFAPFSKLSLIVVDEEQESSFKNLQAPRFHVRDVAIMRARRLGIPVVLGSATPSLEVWHRGGTHDDYELLRLPHRVKNLPLPDVAVIDMRDEHAELKRAVVLSRSMERLLGEALSRGEQAIILLNRRGAARHIFCPDCRARMECPNCNVGFVVHTATGKSICHYCHTRIATPTVCPNVTCGATLVQVGLGTQRVEQILTTLFPDARLARVDSDTMTHRRDYGRIVDGFAAGEIDMLVGTQMIAKGLDFPGVSFVGVVDADPGGLASDFRSQERLFQLLTQVAGRAGRAEAGGKVVVQTTMPELPAIRFALSHDYEAFAEAELKMRRRVGFPPYGRLARIVLSHSREASARDAAAALAARARDVIASEALASAAVMGSNPCPLARLRGRYRFDLLIRTSTAADLRRLLGKLRQIGSMSFQGVTAVIDVDPVAFA